MLFCVCACVCVFLWNLETVYLAISTNQNKVKKKRNRTSSSRVYTPLVGDFYCSCILYISLDSGHLYIADFPDHKHSIALWRKLLQEEIGNMASPIMGELLKHFMQKILIFIDLPVSSSSIKCDSKQ